MDIGIANKNQVNSEATVRIQPYNIQAEQMLLGTLLFNNSFILQLSEFLLSEHFFDGAHQKIYAAISTFYEKSLEANPITLKNYFDSDEILKDRGGSRYLTDLAALSATIIDIVKYGRVIYDLALRRTLIEISYEVANDAFEEKLGISAQEQIDVAEQKLYNLSSNYLEKGQGFVSLGKSLNEAMVDAQNAFNNQDCVTGISSGFSDLDSLLGGFQNSDLIIIAGRPAMGKTACALNIAMNCCEVFFKENKSSPKSVGFFSLEMSSKQLSNRLIAMHSGISTANVRMGQTSKEEFYKIVEGGAKLRELPFFIDDTPALSIPALRARARRLKRRQNLGILFVDYLQLVRPTNVSNKDQNRVQEVSEITRSLKGLAKELNIPIIALSQLSRAVEQREDKRPILADLRDSGTIEQDADIVIFIYREEYYLMHKKPTKQGTENYEKWQCAMEEVRNSSELIISKHRNGPVGNVRLHFDPHLTKFSNLGMMVG